MKAIVLLLMVVFSTVAMAATPPSKNASSAYTMDVCGTFVLARKSWIANKNNTQMYEYQKEFLRKNSDNFEQVCQRSLLRDWLALNDTSFINDL